MINRPFATVWGLYRSVVILSMPTSSTRNINGHWLIWVVLPELGITYSYIFLLHTQGYSLLVTSCCYIPVIFGCWRYHQPTSISQHEPISTNMNQHQPTWTNLNQPTNHPTPTAHLQADELNLDRNRFPGARGANEAPRVLINNGDWVVITIVSC